jgi:hypothetical protein
MKNVVHALLVIGRFHRCRIAQRPCVNRTLLSSKKLGFGVLDHNILGLLAVAGDDGQNFKKTNAANFTYERIIGS